MTELESKYQKLACEYAKVRSQVTVLKKAVLDEQSKAESLKNVIKEKEQSLRKNEQEMDSLTCRNQQLSSRVTILQKQLNETTQSINHKNKKGLSTSVSDFRLKAGAIDEELRLKIEENISLHRQVASLEVEHRNEIVQLEEKLSNLEKQKNELTAENHRLNNVNQQSIQQIIENKTHFQAELLKREIENKELSNSLYKIEKKFCLLNVSPNQENINSLEKRWNLVISRLVDWGKDLISTLDVLLFNANERASLQILNNDSASLLHASKLLQSSIENYNNSSKYLLVFLTQISISKLIFEQFEELFSILKIYINSIEHVFNNLINCLQAECSHNCFPLDLIEINNLLIPSIYELLQNILRIFSTYEEKSLSFNTLQDGEFHEFLDSYNHFIILMVDHFIPVQGLETNVQRKFQIERYLPTTSDSLKITNANIYTSFHQLLLVLARLSNLKIIEPSEDLQNPDSVTFEQIYSPDHQNNRLLSQEFNENKDELLNSGIKMKVFLESEISKLGKRIIDLETEKERLTLDILLLRYKYEKYINSLAVTSNQATEIDMGNELCNREKEIVRYHKEIVHEKILQIQMAESKAIFFQAEFFGLQELLSQNESESKNMEKKLEESQQNISHLKDELVITHRNYEDQLSMMSEHLASLNDTIIKQREEIDALQFQMQQKNLETSFSKKIKS